jgi:hypothetical protein
MMRRACPYCGNYVTADGACSNAGCPGLRRAAVSKEDESVIPAEEEVVRFSSPQRLQAAPGAVSLLPGATGVIRLHREVKACEKRAERLENALLCAVIALNEVRFGVSTPEKIAAALKRANEAVGLVGGAEE